MHLIKISILTILQGTNGEEGGLYFLVRRKVDVIMSVMNNTTADIYSSISNTSEVVSM